MRRSFVFFPSAVGEVKRERRREGERESGRGGFRSEKKLGAEIRRDKNNRVPRTIGQRSVPRGRRNSLGN